MAETSPAAKRVRFSGTTGALAVGAPQAPPGGPGVAAVVVDVKTPIRSGHVEATIRSGDGGGKIGSISARLVQRNVRFHQRCNKISSQLYGIGCVMFEPDGSPRCRELTIDDDAASAGGRGATKTGGEGAFLYVEEVNLADSFRASSDAGARAIAALLDHPQLAGRWTVAAYTGDHRPHMTADERAREERVADNHQLKMMGCDCGPDYYEEGDDFEHQATVRRGVSSDVRPFLRCGFRELGAETANGVGGMFATAEGWERWKRRPAEMTHAEAMRVVLRADAPLDPDKHRNSARDDELQRYLVERGQYLPTGMEMGAAMGMVGGGLGSDTSMWAQSLGMTGRAQTVVTVASIMEEADRMVARGADYNRCNALQACAANGLTALFCPLVNRGALVDGRDGNECTPLMAVATLAPVMTSRNNPPSDGVRALLALGADKDLTDDVGRTALGKFYEAMRSENDKQRCSRTGRHIGTDPVLEKLLMPSGGATAVDKRCKGK